MEPRKKARKIRYFGLLDVERATRARRLAKSSTDALSAGATTVSGIVFSSCADVKQFIVEQERNEVELGAAELGREWLSQKRLS